MERAAFLAHIRDKLSGAPRPDAPVPSDWAVDVEEPVVRFETELEAVGGEFHLAAPSRAALVMGAVLQDHASPRVLVAREAFVPGEIESAVTAAGGEVLWWPEAGREGAAGADVGVSGALWAVAETGTVVVGSAPPGGRAPSLLPPVHVAFVHANRLLPTVRDLFDAIGAMPAYPSNMVLVTGPSKSADIGQELALGVHGPGELHVVLVQSD